MRFLNILFAFGVLGGVILLVSLSGHGTLINAQSISPTMPATLGQVRFSLPLIPAKAGDARARPAAPAPPAA